jgi:hypothetical protein
MSTKKYTDDYTSMSTKATRRIILPCQQNYTDDSMSTKMHTRQVEDGWTTKRDQVAPRKKSQSMTQKWFLK